MCIWIVLLTHLVLSALLNKPLLLVVVLALLAPLGRNIDLIILGFVALFLRLVHARGEMLCGRVDGDELERLIALGDKLMLCASGNDDNVTGLDFLVFACNGCEAAAGCKEEDLVDGVDLTSVSAGYRKQSDGL
jgi:hypothetical protein